MACKATKTFYAKTNKIINGTAYTVTMRELDTGEYRIKLYKEREQQFAHTHSSMLGAANEMVEIYHDLQQHPLTFAKNDGFLSMLIAKETIAAAKQNAAH